MIKLGILGNPVAESLSPSLHDAALRHRGLQGSYARYQVSPKDLESTLAHLLSDHLGLNLTHPLKTAALQFCQKLDPLALKLAAVNTLVAGPKGWLGVNTDGPGLLRDLQQADWQLAQTRALILGAGGAARAAVWALAQLGCRQLVICCRRRAAFEDLHRDLANELDALEYQPWLENQSDVDLIVNATPLGRSEPLEVPCLAPRVLDLNYCPQGTTALCQSADSRGLIWRDGRGLLLQQALLAQDRWFASRPKDLERAMAHSIFE